VDLRKETSCFKACSETYMQLSFVTFISRYHASYDAWTLAKADSKNIKSKAQDPSRFALLDDR